MPTCMIVLIPTLDGGAVWSVTGGRLADLKESRLAGAWVGDQAFLKSLPIWKHAGGVLSRGGFDSAGMGAGPECRPLDPDELVQALASRMREAEAAFNEVQKTRPKSQQLKPLRWPEMPRQPRENAIRGDGPEMQALVWATWLADLAEAETTIEQEIASRKYLADLSTAQQTLF